MNVRIRALPPVLFLSPILRRGARELAPVTREVLTKIRPFPRAG